MQQHLYIESILNDLNVSKIYQEKIQYVKKFKLIFVDNTEQFFTVYSQLRNRLKKQPWLMIKILSLVSGIMFGTK